jgi:hypothetical protein
MLQDSPVKKSIAGDVESAMLLRQAATNFPSINLAPCFLRGICGALQVRMYPGSVTVAYIAENQSTCRQNLYMLA